ncbi:MAG: archaemetzincin family Zn-dependent metalloprotease [Methanoculleaceae archaeon]
MGVQILWDRRSGEGIELPVCRRIADIMEVTVDLTGCPIILNGYRPDRNQYDALKILERLHHAYRRRYDIRHPLLLITRRDLFVPGFDFVFGYAVAPFGTAIVSTHRLHNQFYGRMESVDDLINRTAREGAHEIGHLFGLDHCSDPFCVMFPPLTLDDLDQKSNELCDECRTKLREIRAGNAGVTL